MRKFISVILCFVFFIPAFPVCFAETDYLINETFDNYATNTSPNIFVSSGTGSVRINKESGHNNKTLIIKDTLKLKKDFERQAEKQFVISFETRNTSGNSDFTFGTYNLKGTETQRFSVKSGSVISAKGNKVLAKLSQKDYTKITVLMDFEYGIYNLYADGKCIWHDTEAGFEIPSGIYISNTGGQTEIDNLYSYNGNSVNQEIKSRGYTEDGVEYIDINDDVGGFLYFHSAQLNTITGKYNKTTFTPNGNTYSAPLVENWKDPARKTEIVLSKIVRDSIYMDVLADKDTLYNSTRRYRYFIIDGDFKRTDMSAAAALTLRDFATGVDVVLWKTSSNGSLIMCDGKTVLGVFCTDEYVNIKCAVNIETKSAELYINNELKFDNITLNENLGRINDFRIGMASQDARGDLAFDNLKIAGLENPYKFGESNRTSIFYDEAPVAEFMSDKIGFHYWAQNVTVNNVKHSVKLEYENDKLYADGKDISKILKWNVGEGRIAVKEYAAGIGKSVYDDGNGMIIISDKPLEFNDDNKWFVLREYNNGRIEYPGTIEVLNDYLFFERPSKDTVSADYAKNANGAHPRVYGTKADFDRVRSLRGTDEYFDHVYNKLIAAADEIVNAPDNNIQYVFEGYRMYNQGDKLDDYMTKLGFAYQMTGDRKYVDRAWKEFEILFTFPDINPAHIIDTGMIQIGISVGYDWMYDAWTDEQRRQIEEFEMTKGLGVMSGIYYGDFNYQAFVSAKWVSNYNAFVNAGNIVASLAFMDVDPEFCSETLSKAIRSTEYTLKGFVPDGAWCEGPNYWGLTTRFLTDIFTTLEASCGTEYGLTKYQGLSKTVDFFTAISSYGGYNNYHDSYQTLTRSFFSYAYFAKRFDNALLYLPRKTDTVENPGAYLGRTGHAAYNPIELLCYTDDMKNTSLDKLDTLPKANYFRGVDIFSFRDSYYKNDGLFFSAHAGAVTAYHSHNDAGTFVFDHLGERWAMDLGQQTYNVVKDSEAYRKRTEGHNTLTINNHSGFNQTANTFAPIVRFEGNDASGIAVTDMSAIYPDANKALRGYMISDNYQSVTIRDELELSKSSSVYWFMHTQADMYLDGNTVYMTKNGKHMTAEVYVDGSGVKDYTVSIAEAEPLENSPNPAGQDSNKGTKKISVNVIGEGKVNITVKMSPTGSRAETVPISTIPISEWKLEEKTEQDMTAHTIPVTFYADGVEISPNDDIMIKTADGLPKITAVPHSENITVSVKEAKIPSDTTFITLTDNNLGIRNVYTFSYYNEYVRGLDTKYKVINVDNYSVSVESEPANPGIHIMDNVFETRWTSVVKGEYALFDLGSEQEIDALAVAFWKGAIRNYHYSVFVSSDGVNYEQVTAGKSDMANGENYNIINFASVKARYVKFVGDGFTGTPSGNNTNILELRILKTE